MLDISFSAFPELRTDRCVLRKPLTDDAAELLYLRSNDQVMRYVDREKMTSEGEAVSMLEKIGSAIETGEGISWAISFPGDQKMVGLAGIWRIDKANHRGEVGYMIHPGLWNKGYISETMSAIMQYGFGAMNLHSLEANVNPANAASIRVLEKLGFVKEAYFRENYYFQGNFLDSVIYSRIRDNGK